MADAVEAVGEVLGTLTDSELREWMRLQGLQDAAECGAVKTGDLGVVGEVYERKQVLAHIIHQRLRLAPRQEWGIYGPSGIVVSEGDLADKLRRAQEV